MAAQYDVNLEECALLKCLCGSCPAVIKSYNANMGGIDKSDMLVHLYRTPMKSKRWYMWMVAYAIDVS